LTIAPVSVSLEVASKTTPVRSVLPDGGVLANTVTPDAIRKQKRIRRRLTMAQISVEYLKLVLTGF
jgi:hypothetical protein